MTTATPLGSQATCDLPGQGGLDTTATHQGAGWKGTDMTWRMSAKDDKGRAGVGRMGG